MSWFTRPSIDLAGNPIPVGANGNPKNARCPVPKQAPSVFDMMTSNERALHQFLMQTGKEDSGGFLCPAPSLTKLGRELRLHKVTVWRNVMSLAKKGLLRIYDRDHFEGTKGIRRTIYYLPHFDIVLKEKRADPALYHTPQGHCLIIGRGRRLLSVEQARLWNIQPEKIPRTSDRDFTPGAAEQQDHQPPPAAARPASRSHAPPRQQGVKPPPEKQQAAQASGSTLTTDAQVVQQVRRAIESHTKTPCDTYHVKAVIRRAEQGFATLPPDVCPLDGDGIVALIHSIAASTSNVKNAGLFTHSIEARVIDNWADVSTAIARRRIEARERTIEALMWCFETIESSDPSFTAEERAQAQAIVESADPAAVAEARQRREAGRKRAVGG
jgi:hypothetical protein